MTNFIYNMQDELFHLNAVLPLGDFSTITKLVNHIEAQSKQLRELNAAIAKRNATIEKYERENEELQERNSNLCKKVGELNEGVRDSEDLTWKQKYDALLQSSEQAIGALQNRCKELERCNNNQVDTIDRNKEITRLLKNQEKLKEENEALKAASRPWGDNSEIIASKTLQIKMLESDKKVVEKRCREAEKALEDEKQVSKDLNVIINHKNKLLDEYMTKYNNLEHNYKEEVRMKEQLKTTCFKHERTIEDQDFTIKYLKGQVANVENFEKENRDLRKGLSIIEDTIKRVRSDYI